MLAHHANKADRCPGCGLPLNITTGHEHVYAINTDTVCHACQALAADDKARADRKPRPGVLRTIMPMPRPLE